VWNWKVSPLSRVNVIEYAPSRSCGNTCMSMCTPPSPLDRSTSSRMSSPASAAVSDKEHGIQLCALVAEAVEEILGLKPQPQETQPLHRLCWQHLLILNVLVLPGRWRHFDRPRSTQHARGVPLTHANEETGSCLAELLGDVRDEFVQSIRIVLQVRREKEQLARQKIGLIVRQFQKGACVSPR